LANSRTRKRNLSVLDLGLTAANSVTGVAALTITGGTAKLTKAAAATVSVVNIPVPKQPIDAGFEDGRIASVSVAYSVATAGLTGAPTATLNKQTINATTGAVTTATIAGTLTFVGTNAVGTAIGDYIATFTVTAPAATADTDALFLALTMNEAATSVLSINGASVDYSG